MPRLFIGIKIRSAKSSEDTLSDLKEEFSQCSIKWVETKNYHITLKFLGDVEEYYINSLIMLLDQIACRSPKFTLESTGLGYFGTIKHPRVIWLGFKPNTGYKNLRLSIEESLDELGFEKSGVNNLPHLTLGRVKSLSSKADLKAILTRIKSVHEKYPVTKFSLVKSTLTKQGSIYRTIKEFTLAGK
jgi:2'-5' RNA ligase